MEKITPADQEFPAQLMQNNDSPKQLYVEGNINLLSMPSIAIVGSRKCTEYGIKQAKRFSKELSQKGICIVSGLALGIDSIAHQAALPEKGKTIAVLGCGFHHIYPPENEELYYQIIEQGGCVLSEYEPEKQADLSQFPRRNRIISSLSMGTLVIEAAYRSGSTITARDARKEKKEVFCIPHNLESRNAYGVNLLIQEGANLVMCPQDILQILQWNEPQNTMNLPQEYQVIYDAISYTPTPLQKISQQSKHKIEQINEILFMLEMEGLIERLPGNQFIRTKE